MRDDRRFCGNEAGIGYGVANDTTALVPLSRLPSRVALADS